MRQRQRRPSARQAGTVPLGETHGGFDTRRVQVVDLPPGVAALSVVHADDYLILIAVRIPHGQAAQLARHVAAQHLPVLRDAGWDSLACSVATCAEARRWLAHSGVDVTAAGL